MYKFYTNLSFQQSLDHWQPNWSQDNPYTFRQWYEEDIQGRDTLLIMVGDSWTWGDHLGIIDWDKASNDPVRMEQIAGRKLSNLLNADWVNIARPGCSNYWMIEQLMDIKSHIESAKDRYKKIHVVVALTEDLREATYTRRINVTDTYMGFWDKSTGIENFLQQVEAFLFHNLEQYFKQLPFVKAHICRVFTDVWSANTSNLLLDKSWCDVIQDKINFNNYQKPVPFIGQMSIDPLTQKFITTKPERKEEFVNIMERVATRWNFLGHSRYNLKGSTCHPNPEGHQLWAEYLYSQIQ